MSPPFDLPPAMRKTGCWKRESAASAAWKLVALESFHQVTPAKSPTLSSRWRAGAKVRAAE